MVKSPCINICELDKDDVCVGCGRTRKDIAVWSSAPESVKAQIVKLAAQRKQMLDTRQAARAPRR